MSKTKHPPFLLTFEIFNHNVHNCLVDSGVSINVMPISVCKKINGQPRPTTWRVVQLDRTDVKVVGEMEDVLIRLASDDKVCQVINIVVAKLSCHVYLYSCLCVLILRTTICDLS